MTNDDIKALREMAAAEGNVSLVALCNAARMLGRKDLLKACAAEWQARQGLR